MRASHPPAGIVTFLFTDVEGSTRLLQGMGAEPYAATLVAHREILRTAFGDRGGVEMGGEGDSLFYVFADAGDAVAAVEDAQRRLAGLGLAVRMGLHTGEPLLLAGEYIGIDVHRASRIAAAAHGGQVLLSETTAKALDFRKRKDLGEHRLKDLSRPERIFQLLAAGLPEAFPPIRSLDVHSHNLPVQPTPLVGREREIVELRELLTRPDVHLLTVTGPGGAGKTRLALQAAAESIEEFPGGVYFVDLAPLADPAMIPGTILQAVGIQEGGGRSMPELLKEFFGGKRVLFLLDNFEQLLESAPRLAEALRGVPGLTFLATSRAPLRIRDEHEYPLGPLPLPGSAEHRSIGRLAHYDSVRLFVERARAVRPDFALTEENASAVAEICLRLDGLPLAIELAAARSRIFSPQALLSRLSNRLDLLVGGARDLPDRHRTLRAAIAWSHSLLSTEEATLFRRISVFSGDFGLDAVEGFCCVRGEMELDPLEATSSLVEKNLLRADTEQAEPRFRMLETILEFAREELRESGEADAVARRHAEFYLQMAEEAAPHLTGADQAGWLERIGKDYSNLRAAMQWALSAGTVEIAARIAAAIRVFWMTRGLLAEGRLLTEGIAARMEGSLPELRAKILGCAGNLARQQARFDDARRLFEGALETYTAAGDARGRGVALTNLGAVAVEQGENERAEPLFEESLALLSKLGEERLMAMAQVNLGVLAEIRGDLDTAEKRYAQSLELTRRVGDLAGVGLALGNLSHLCFERGELETAARLTRESLKLAAETGNTYTAAYDLVALALHSLEVDPRRATRLLAAGNALFEAAGAQAAPIAHARFERAVARTREQLAPDVWQAEWKAGSEMSLEDAVKAL